MSSDPDVYRTMSRYNHPFWFGPWAKGIRFDPSQDTGTKAAANFQWQDANQVVCHAMAVGEWGGVQFRVAHASSAGGGKTDLIFSHGGYQQARGAAFRHGSSRYYLEGDRQVRYAPRLSFPLPHSLFLSSTVPGRPWGVALRSSHAGTLHHPTAGVHSADGGQVECSGGAVDTDRHSF